MLSRTWLAAALISAGTVVLTAQSPADPSRATLSSVEAPEGQRARFRSSLDLVSVAVVVRGPDGRLVPNLRATDFEVLDRGTSRPIVHFHRGSEADARLALLVDASGSMVIGAKRQRSRIAAELLVAGFRNADAASVFSFDLQLRRLTPFTSDPAELIAAVASVDSWGVTGLYDAIVGTVQTVTNESPRARALLLLTDGIDTASVFSPGDAASAAAALDIPLYVLAVSDDDSDGRVAPSEANRAAVTLNELATRTGGLAAEATTIAELSTVTRTILTELRHQYTLAFPAGTSKGWHDLIVRVKRGRVQARSRNGYLVS